MTHVSRSTLILAISFATNTLLALIRQVIIARQFGLSMELDAYNAANNIPDLLFALISGGALAFAFIPVLSEYLEKKGNTETWKLFSYVLNISFLVTAVLCVFVAFGAEHLVRWEYGIAPGFTDSQQDLVAHLMRINLIATLIFSMSGLVMSGLQAHQHFMLTAFAPPLYNVGQIIGALMLAPSVPYQLGPVTLPAFGFGVEGLVYGVLIGAGMHLCVQVPALIWFRFRWHWGVPVRDEGVWRVLRLMAPRVLTVFLIQLIFLARDNFASRLEEGAITALAYGWTIMQVPQTLIGTAIGTALLPTLSEQASGKDATRFVGTINKATRLIFSFGFFVTILSMLALYPLIEPVFGFSPEETSLLVWTARGYLFGLLGHTLLEVIARAFYAEQNAKTPFVATAVRFFVFVGVSIALFQWIGVVGIALADSIAVMTEVVILFVLMKKRLPALLQVRETVIRTLAGTVVCVGLFLLLVYAFTFVSLPLSDQIEGVLVYGGAAVVAGVLYLYFVRNEARMLVKL